MIKKVNNKGFVFIETIITAVILLTTLLLLYKSYSDVIIKEKRRLYYDDIAYIYKTIAIRDVLKKSYNKTTFDTAVTKNKNCASSGVGSAYCKYIYFFNVESPIYNDNTDMKSLRDFLNFYQLAYINLSDITNLKKCTPSSTDNLCKNTIKFINSYSYNNFLDYIKTLDIDETTNYNGHSGILVSIFFLTKTGERINNASSGVAFGKYDECLQNKVHTFYKTYKSSSITLANAMKEYNLNKDLNFSIQCSYAYYYSWVYL